MSRYKLIFSYRYKELIMLYISISRIILIFIILVKLSDVNP